MTDYLGHFLYAFSGDTAPGQTDGQGKGGKWFVATLTLPVQNGVKHVGVSPGEKGFC
jgi:hypothetical protein